MQRRRAGDADPGVVVALRGRDGGGGRAALMLLRPVLETARHMSFHPNDIVAARARRERASSPACCCSCCGGVLPQPGAPAPEVRAAVGDQPAARAAAARAARRDLRSQRQGDRRQRDRLFGVGAGAEGGHAARGAAAAQRHDQHHAAADRAGGAPLPPRADAAHGDHPGRVVRRRQRARGAPDAVSRADHPERAAPLLSRRSGRRAVRRLHRRSDRGRARAAARSPTTRPGSRSASRGSRSSTSASCAARKGASSSRWMRAGASCAASGARPDLAAGGGAPTCTRTSTWTSSASSRASSATRCRAARWRIDPEDRRRARALQRAELGRQPLHRRHSRAVLGLAAHRSAQAALQQGAPGTVSAGLHLEARHDGRWGSRRAR